MTGATVPEWLAPSLAGRDVDSLDRPTLSNLLSVLIAYVENGSGDDEVPALVDQTELQRLLGISRQTLWSMRKRGTLPEPKAIGRRLYWRKSDLADLIDTHEEIDPLS